MAAARQPGIGAGFKQWQKSSEAKPRNSEPADENGHRWRKQDALGTTWTAGLQIFSSTPLCRPLGRRRRGEGSLTAIDHISARENRELPEGIL